MGRGGYDLRAGHSEGVLGSKRCGSVGRGVDAWEREVK